MTVISFIQRLHWMLMSPHNTFFSGSLTDWPFCKCLNNGKNLVEVWFSILDNEKTLLKCGNACSSCLKVAIQTCPHREKYVIISWLLMPCLHCGPSTTNYQNCLLCALKRRHPTYDCFLTEVCCIIGMTEILIVIDVVCEVSKSLETPVNVILYLHCWNWAPLREVIKGLDFGLQVFVHSLHRLFD